MPKYYDSTINLLGIKYESTTELRVILYDQIDAATGHLQWQSLTNDRLTEGSSIYNTWKSWLNNVIKQLHNRGIIQIYDATWGTLRDNNGLSNDKAQEIFGEDMMKVGRYPVN